MTLTPLYWALPKVMDKKGRPRKRLASYAPAVYFSMKGRVGSGNTVSLGQNFGSYRYLVLVRSSDRPSSPLRALCSSKPFAQVLSGCGSARFLPGYTTGNNSAQPRERRYPVLIRTFQSRPRIARCHPAKSLDPNFEKAVQLHVHT
jgi:hypothetical protein